MSAVDVARTFADTVLFPEAQHVDRTAVPASHLDALATAGLFDLGGLTASETRRVFAAIGSGCGATFFVWVQHHGVVRNLDASSNTGLRAELLDDFRTGRRLAGVAFAHVRRPGTPAVGATRTDGGWLLDGHAPWATSWGLADSFCVAAESPHGDMVWSMLPGDGGTGVTAHRLHLPVFAATGTIAMDFDQCAVSDDQVVAVGDIDSWRLADRRRAALGQPAVLGVADRAVRLLSERGPGAAAAATRLGVELDRCWRRDDELVAIADAMTESTSTQAVESYIAVASDHRAACLDLARRATTAFLAASGGGGMDLSHPAQRLAREATFYVIQAQTGDGRAATLRNSSTPSSS